MKLFVICMSGACLLAACESKPGPKQATVLPPLTGLPGGLFAGLDSTVYRLDSANITGCCYLLAPLKEDGQFATVFYRPTPTQAWQEVATLPNVEALDTANLDRRGRAELLVRNAVRADGSGGGTACHSLAIYQCGAVARKVFEAPTRYVDEWFGFDGPNTGHYYESTQAITVGYGTLRVGRPRINKAIDCNGYALCLSCTPRLPPGRYALRHDTVTRVVP